MKEFIELVRKMRNAQKEYFRTRDKRVLQESKQLECRVDAILAQQVDKQQLSLFDDMLKPTTEDFQTITKLL